MRSNTTDPYPISSSTARLGADRVNLSRKFPAEGGPESYDFKLFWEVVAQGWRGIKDGFAVTDGTGETALWALGTDGRCSWWMVPPWPMGQQAHGALSGRGGYCSGNSPDPKGAEAETADVDWVDLASNTNDR